MHTYIHNITLHYITLHYITLHYITLHTYIHTYIHIFIYIMVWVITWGGPGLWYYLSLKTYICPSWNYNLSDVGQNGAVSDLIRLIDQGGMVFKFINIPKSYIPSLKHLVYNLVMNMLIWIWPHWHWNLSDVWRNGVCQAGSERSRGLSRAKLVCTIMNCLLYTSPSPRD